jgi:DedD protein
MASSSEGAAKGGAALVSAPARKGGFMLQLSSFQDRGEADAFARRFAGQNAYVTASEVPGKGTVYRVRVGSYSTLKEAANAKTSFERDHNVIAYVAGSGPAN